MAGEREHYIGREAGVFNQIGTLTYADPDDDLIRRGWSSFFTELLAIVQSPPSWVGETGLRGIISMDYSQIESPRLTLMRGALKFLAAQFYQDAAGGLPLFRACEEHNSVELLRALVGEINSDGITATASREKSVRQFHQEVVDAIDFQGQHDEYSILGSTDEQVQAGLKRFPDVHGNYEPYTEAEGAAFLLNLWSLRIREDEPIRRIKGDGKLLRLLRKISEKVPSLEELQALMGDDLDPEALLFLQQQGLVQTGENGENNPQVVYDISSTGLRALS